MIRQLRFILEFAVLRGVLLILALPPRRMGLMLGRGLGRFVHGLGIRRAVVASNLLIAFPDWTPEKRADVARRTYEHFGMVLVDTASIFHWSEAQLRERTTLVNYEIFRKALATGRGVVLATAHLGGFDVGPGRIALEGALITGVFQGVRNPYIERYITRIRTRGGAMVAKRGIQFRKVLRALKSGDCVGFLADQDAGSRGLFLPFFSRRASTLSGPAAFAERTGAVLLTGFVPVIDGKYTLIFEEPLPPGSMEDRMGEYNRRLERIIRQFPDQYFWLHKRWRTPPPIPVLPIAPPQIPQASVPTSPPVSSNQP